ncbi:hypothetical protein ABMA27_013519 [Loxostege sticticalis]|uniref:Myrosinase 1-like n=1 Tax=Loxostege sticticalis TaxID=481309 RepID=A0ABR3IFK4_LOXSC
MTFKRIALCLFISQIIVSDSKTCCNHRNVRKFPDGFLFGSASASYQVEGGWNEDGKSENIWDHDTHQIPNLIADESTGDVADDSYHLYKRDVEMVRELGLDYYRFSLSWTRLLPTSFPDQINQAGVDYYNNLINELLKYNIKPMVTLFHWDLPQKLQEMGGWTNPHAVDWYGDYARIAFELFGDRVKHWITMNEPTQICYFGYGLDLLAPRLNIPGLGEYHCSKYLLLAHARAYHIYNEEFRASQEGTIFITLSAGWHLPESEKDTDATRIMQMFDLGIYAHPIFSKSGDWPLQLKEIIARKSAEQGFKRSRLPDFTPEEVEYLRGTSDLFGLNHYSTYYVSANETMVKNYEVPSRADDAGVHTYDLDAWKLSEFSSTKAYPLGFYQLLTHIREEYDNPSVFVTENGYGSYDLSLEDDDRVAYYRGYISAMLDAIDDSSDIIGYTAWCLMDNFEWSSGYTVRFGLYHVDHEDPQRPRTPRKSAFVFKEIVRSRALDLSYEPDMTVMAIDEGH